MGGGLGANSSVGHLLFTFLPDTDILYVAEAIKQLFSEHGNRRNKHKARIRYIFYKLGEEKVFGLFHNYFNQLKKEGNYELKLPELPVDIQKGSPIKPASNNLSYTNWLNRYVKTQVQDGLFAVEIPFEQGITDAQSLEVIARYIIPFGSDSTRLTMRQNMLLRNISGEDLLSLFDLLYSLKIETGLPRIQNNIVACTGADTCRLGICLAKGASTAIKSSLKHIDEVTQDKLANVKINLSGCPNSCGQHTLSPIGFYGKASRNDRLYPAYYVTVGGQSGFGKAKLGETIGEISARNLPLFTREILAEFAESIDTFPDFSTFLENGGKNTILNLLSKYHDIPSFEDDKNYYFDWGAQELFSLKGKGKAECSAGMFDMIDLDRDAIMELQEKLAHSPSVESANQVLYKIAFHASRMLLVTRGVEPKSREEVFVSFIGIFINEGYIDARFIPVVRLALQHPEGHFSEYRQTVLELASSVIDLYNSMDDSLQFKVSQEKPKTKEPENEKKETRFKDFRGVACPMNFVKTKIELAQMNTGELLEILLDNGSPINNVPGSVRGEGHEIIRQEKINDHWLVVIKK